MRIHLSYLTTSKIYKKLAPIDDHPKIGKGADDYGNFYNQECRNNEKINEKVQRSVKNSDHMSGPPQKDVLIDLRRIFT